MLRSCGDVMNFPLREPTLAKNQSKLEGIKVTVAVATVCISGEGFLQGLPVAKR
jgi:hypothetical protein